MQKYQADISKRNSATYQKRRSYKQSKEKILKTKNEDKYTLIQIKIKKTKLGLFQEFKVSLILENLLMLTLLMN